MERTTVADKVKVQDCWILKILCSAVYYSPVLSLKFQNVLKKLQFSCTIQKYFWSISSIMYCLYLSHLAGYRETAYLHAISSASLVHTFSRACAQGNLDRCTCDESFALKKNKEAWLWGGCGDNIKYGLKFAKKFLRWMRKSQDLQATSDSHNSDVGIRVRAMV